MGWLRVLSTDHKRDPLVARLHAHITVVIGFADDQHRSRNNLQFVSVRHVRCGFSDTRRFVIKHLVLKKPLAVTDLPHLKGIVR